MTTKPEIVDRMARMNPIPDPATVDESRLAALASLVEQRRSGMIKTRPPTKRQVPGITRRRALAFGSALVLVLVVVGAVAMLSGGSDPDVAGEPSPAPAPAPAPAPVMTLAPDVLAPPIAATEAPATSTAPLTTMPATPATAPPEEPPPSPPVLPVTIDDLRTVFNDPAMWSDELRELYEGSSLRVGHVMPGLEIGSLLAFEATTLEGGEFSTDELAGRPALVVAWYGQPDSFDWRQAYDNLDALQTVYDSFADGLAVVSVFVPYGSLIGSDDTPDEAYYTAISDELARRGYTFPVAIEPTTADGEPMTTWVDLSDAMPAWVLLDETGTIVDGFVGIVRTIPVTFLLAELVE